MGYNTVIFLHNDSLRILEDDPKQVCDNIYSAIMDGKTQDVAHHYKKGGIDVNPITVMKTRHADDKTIYVFQGNTLCEMNAWSSETEELMKKHPDFFESMLKDMQYNVTRLKKKFKEFKESQDG